MTSSTTKRCEPTGYSPYGEIAPKRTVVVLPFRIPEIPPKSPRAAVERQLGFLPPPC